MEATTQKKYIKYRRVSTDHQGDSGWGLADQDCELEKYIAQQKGILAGEFMDVSTGKNESRAGLHNAIAACKSNGATLLIWELSRISRRRLFVEELLSSDVDFVVVSQPSANKLLLRILADIDANEVEQVSSRTKRALAMKMATGWKAGTPQNLTDEGRRKGAQSIRTAAMENEHNRKAAMFARSLRDAGNTLQQICDKLEEGGFKTASGGKFHPASISRVLSRYENKTVA